MSDADVTYHLVAEPYYRECDPGDAYVPEEFDRDGFIHCTNGLELLVRVANRYYRHDPRPYLILSIDTGRISAEVRYDDGSRLFPHIYGRLNRDAIVDARRAERLPRGAFVVPVGGLPTRKL